MKMKALFKSPVSRTATRFILRPYRRIPTWYISYYMSGDYVGKGVVTNLSCTGMRVLGDHAMKPGTELTIRVAVGEDRPSIEIERVRVQWVKACEFGLRIVFVSRSSAKQITQLLIAQAGTHRGGS